MSKKRSQCATSISVVRANGGIGIHLHTPNGDVFAHVNLTTGSSKELRGELEYFEKGGCEPAQIQATVN